MLRTIFMARTRRLDGIFMALRRTGGNDPSQIIASVEAPVAGNVMLVLIPGAGSATGALMPTTLTALPPPLRWLQSTPFYQAGLQGYSDAPMRIVARRHGAPYCVTESLLDEVLVRGGKGLEACELDAEDHPIAGQIIGTDPATMARAARLLLSLGYDVIDINLACPVKKMRGLCRGGHLLTRPDVARDILQAVRDAVAGEAPVTVKLRRGYDDSAASAASFFAVFESALELGMAAATVHCRTVEQKYEGAAHWPFLAELTRRYPEAAILGSGDIHEVGDIFRMLGETGVRGVSVARGAIGNPWIFRQARQIQRGEPPSAPTLEEQRQALLEHFELSVRALGEEAAGRMMRKVAIKMSRHHPQGADVLQTFGAVRTSEEWWEALERWYGPPLTSPAAPSARAETSAARAGACAATPGRRETSTPPRRR
jgi:nifR3 family TIM-barrel protein